MKSEKDIDLELIFEEETGKEWHRTLPHEYTDWLEEKLKKEMLKNLLLADVVGQSEQLLSFFEHIQREYKIEADVTFGEALKSFEGKQLYITTGYQQY